MKVLPNMEQRLSRLTRIYVEDLFGHYTHDIELHLDRRVTIMHGPNGVGKTALLKLINSLFAASYADFQRVPFKRLEISLLDGRTIECVPSELLMNGSLGKGTTFYLSEPGRPRFERFDFILTLEMKNAYASRIENEVPWLSRYDGIRWHDQRNGLLLTSDDIVMQNSDRLPEKVRRELSGEPPWLTDVRSAVRIHLIETQRLLKLQSEGPGSRSMYLRGAGAMMATAVRSYALELQQRISQDLARYATESQNLDQTFPQRLLSDQARVLNNADLKRAMAELDGQRAALRDIGLIEDAATYPFKEPSLDALDDSKLAVMALYVEDTKAKLRVLESLSNRITLLLQIVNRKFRHKRITVTPETGLAAVGEDGTALDLEALSSGEQHELVLTYDLLFKVKPNTLVLIDEPELSLHVVWQKAFLPDILSIVNTSQFDVLTATHSPYIAGDESDLMIELSDEIPA